MSGNIKIKELTKNRTKLKKSVSLKHKEQKKKKKLIKLTIMDLTEFFSVMVPYSDYLQTTVDPSAKEDIITRCSKIIHLHLEK